YCDVVGFVRNSVFCFAEWPSGPFVADEIGANMGSTNIVIPFTLKNRFGERRKLVIKAYPHVLRDGRELPSASVGRGVYEYRALTYLSSLLGAEYLEPTPLLYYDGPGYLVMQDYRSGPGRFLVEQEDLRFALAAFGGMLGRVHKASLGRRPRELERVELLRSLIEFRLLSLSAELGHMVGTESLVRFAATEGCFVLADPKPEHVFVRGRRFALLDLDWAMCANHQLDVDFFLFAVATSFSGWVGDIVTHLRGFLEGYYGANADAAMSSKNQDCFLMNCAYHLRRCGISDKSILEIAAAAMDARTANEWDFYEAMLPLVVDCVVRTGAKSEARS
ncbi:MAG: hypothetical protein FJY85_06000, partial [Deltaproteobacteria bacterium]|nr:hypothetical protein [Deltaproteobacteria bacterium]